MAHQADEGGVLSFATRVRELKDCGDIDSHRRDLLISKLPRVTASDIASMPEQRLAKSQFRGKLTNGEAVVFEPLAWKREETPRRLSIYAEISRTVNIQRFIGVFHDASSNTYYAVMEDLDGDEPSFVLLKDALSNQLIANASRIQRLRLSYEIALAVAYLHSLNIVIKVISERSFYVKEVNGEFVPVLTDLEYARLVSLWLRETHVSRPCLTQITSVTTLAMTHQSTLPKRRGKVALTRLTPMSGGDRWRSIIADRQSRCSYLAGLKRKTFARRF
jgi:serine/threonine protein kinase